MADSEDLVDVVVSFFRRIFSPVTPGKIPYDKLPQAPPEPLPVRSWEELAPRFRPRAQALFGDLNRILAVAGYKAEVVETWRSPARQEWLYGIGRDYQAPGRTGTVTEIRDPSKGKHGQRVAFDVTYKRVSDGKVVSKKELEEKVVPVVRPFGEAAPARYGISWGGTWKTFKDWPHWEDAP